jgi:hypothetical protein
MKSSRCAQAKQISLRTLIRKIAFIPTKKNNGVFPLAKGCQRLMEVDIPKATESSEMLFHHEEETGEMV